MVRSEQLTPHMIRVVLGGSGFDTFVPSDFTDSYVKIVIVRDDIDVAALPQPLTLDSFNELPEAKPPVVRTYTVRHVDADSREISDRLRRARRAGVAGPWAASAAPRRAGLPDGTQWGLLAGSAADWHLLAGGRGRTARDQRALEAMPPNAVGQAFIEVRDPTTSAITAPEGVQVRWIYRSGRADLVPEEQAGDHAPLIAAVKEAPWLPGQVQVFIHGEAQAVMHNLRSYIRKERGVDAKWASISGYWRRGRTEETFRQWKAELAKAGVSAAE